MDVRNPLSTVETFSLRSGQAAEAAEEMAKAATRNADARAAFSRLLVQQSKSFGAYVSQKIEGRGKRSL